VELVGPGGLLAELTKRVLEAELAEHVGYAPYDPAGHHSGNSRNGTRSKSGCGECLDVACVDLDLIVQCEPTAGANRFSS